MPPLHLATDLVAAALFVVLREPEAGGAQLARSWHAERERLYELPVGDERERAFVDLERGWFARLRLGEPLERALSACPCLRERVQDVVVRRALRARDEGAELLVARADASSARVDQPPARVTLLVRAERFLDGSRLHEFALGELLRLEDMVDPTFGFDPDPSLGLELEPHQRELARGRLAALWDARIRGRTQRLLGQGDLLPGPGTDFRRVFGALEEERLVALHAAAWVGQAATFAGLVQAAIHSPGRPQGAADVAVDQALLRNS